MKKIIISIIATLALVIVPASFAHATNDWAYYGDSYGSYDYGSYDYSGSSYTQTTAAPCSPTDFTADEYTLNAGEGTVLHWDSTAGCDSARIDPASYPQDRPPYGSVSTGRIDQSTVFTLTVYDAQGNIGGQRFLTVNIRSSSGGGNPPPSSDCRIDSFDADDTSIQDGDSTDLRWRTTGCDRVKINQGIGDVNLDGSESVDPSETTTYTLSAYDDSGRLADTDTVKITVEDNNSCSIDSFKASDNSIERGDSVTLSWRTTDAQDVDLSPGGSYGADDSVTVRPNYTTTYELTANCKHGSDKHKSITIDVNGDNRSSQPQAVTTVATITSPTSAQLNGIAFPNTTSGTTRAWFQWGPSTALNLTTAQQSVSSGNSQTYYNAPISGIVPGTQYYYRAVVQNQNGIAYGDIVPFRSIAATPTTTVVRTVQVQGSSVTAKSAPSLLELRVDSAYDRMCVGGTIDYTVTYRNISSQTLRDAVLQINHQKEITFVGASRGTYDVVDRTVTVALGDIAPGETGTVILHGRVNSDAVQGSLTVMTAQVVYTNSVTKAQESAIAYSLVTVTNDCPNILGASAFGFGHFLPNTLLEWLLLILVILALIVLGRNLRKKPKPPVA